MLSFLPKKLNFLHGILFFVIINLLSLLITSFFDFDAGEIYQDLNLPSFAPPTFAFGIVWPINNVLTIAGNIWGYNLYQSLKRKEDNNPAGAVLKSNIRTYGWWQAVSWFNYIIFQALAFGTEIPFLFFAPTFSMFIFTSVSIYYAAKIDIGRQQIDDTSLTAQEAFWATVKKGNSIFFSLSTLILWLALASIVGGYVWLNN